MINAMRLGRSSLVAARFPFNPKKCGDLHFWRYFLAFGMLALRERLCSCRRGIIWGWLAVSSLSELKDGECLTGAWCQRGDSGHHLHSQVQLLLVPLPYSSPGTTPGLTEKLLCLSPFLSTNCGLQLPSFHPSLSQSLQEVKTIRTLFHGSPWVRAFTSTFAFFLSISPNSERSRSLEVALGC